MLWVGGWLEKHLKILDDRFEKKTETFGWQIFRYQFQGKEAGFGTQFKIEHEMWDVGQSLSLQFLEALIDFVHTCLRFLKLASTFR